MVAYKSFTYDPDLDRDIHEFLNSLPERRGAFSEAMRDIIRFYIARQDQASNAENAALTAIDRRLEQIEETLASLSRPAISPPGHPTAQEAGGDIPEDVLKNLLDLSEGVRGK